MERRFVQLDVFGDRALAGNGLAVVVDGDGLDDATMARFARWTNLSETTFLLPPTDPRPTTGCASSPPPVSCRSRVTPRWGRRGRGGTPAACHAGTT